MLVIAKKRFKPEQIVARLRQIEVGIANGTTTPQTGQEAEITEQTSYRWRKEYRGVKSAFSIIADPFSLA